MIETQPGSFDQSTAPCCLMFPVSKLLFIAYGSCSHATVNMKDRQTEGKKKRRENGKHDLGKYIYTFAFISRLLEYVDSLILGWSVVLQFLLDSNLL